MAGFLGTLFMGNVGLRILTPPRAAYNKMASDFGPLKVRVNAIAPGEVETDILSEGTDKIVKDIPLKRLGLPEEVANTIFFLCNNQSSYISGAEVHINGGQHV